MARSKQEIRDFLNSQVGQKVNAKAGIYNGQCVSLVKALLEFLGVENPYGARGNAKDVGDTLLRQGIAQQGAGWLTVAVNRSMGVIGGVNYGHIWLDLKNEANYEQNGAKALHTTKNTRPIQQAQQLINLDKYVAPDAPRKSNEVIASEVIAGAWGNGDDRKARLKAAGYDPAVIQSIVNGKVSGSKPAPKASNDEVAQQVINGAWGNGDDRKNRLSAAGYDPATIQALVNKKLGAGNTGRKSNEEIANEVIAMKWGKGQERKDRLAQAGYDYNAVQAIVNRKLGF